MKRFNVTEVTEIRTTFIVEAKDAVDAVRKVKRADFGTSPNHSMESHHIARELIEEEKINDKQ